MSACAFDADLDGTRFACDDTTDCPDGFACAAGQCVADGVEEEDPDDFDPASCSGDASDVSDDFDDDDIDDGWLPFASEGAETGQDGDAYIILNGGAFEVGAGFMTRCSYDMRDDAVYVEVEELAGGDADTYFEITTTGNEFAAMIQRGAQLTVRSRGGASNRVESTSVDAAAGWWMISGADGTVQFWTASNEGDWTLVSTHAIPDGFEAAHISFGARSDATEAATTVEARFDNFNGG